MKMKKIRHKEPIKQRQKWTLLLIILISVFSSQAGTTYDLNKSVIASGAQATGAQYLLQAAIGQNITTKSVSTSYQLTAGFYQENRDLIFFNEFESNQ